MAAQRPTSRSDWPTCTAMIQVELAGQKIAKGVHRGIPIGGLGKHLSSTCCRISDPCSNKSGNSCMEYSPPCINLINTICQILAFFRTDFIATEEEGIDYHGGRSRRCGTTVGTAGCASIRAPPQCTRRCRHFRVLEVEADGRPGAGEFYQSPGSSCEAGKPAVEPGTPYEGKVKKRPAEIICGAAN